MSYRVGFAAGAALQYHTLPHEAQDALIDRVVHLVADPWDAVVRAPGADPAFRETTFGDGHGLLGFHVDDTAKQIRIFDIVWLG